MMHAYPRPLSPSHHFLTRSREDTAELHADGDARLDVELLPVSKVASEATHERHGARLEPPAGVDCVGAVGWGGDVTWAV